MKKTILFLAMVGLLANAVEKPWLVLNEDNDYYFKKDASFMTEAKLREHITELAGMKVTHLFLCPSGQRTSYDSKVWEPIWKGLGCPNQSSKGQPTNDIWCVNAKILFDQGIDPYKVWIDQCRKEGISPWLTPRMNDNHFAHITNYFRNTTFWETHQNLWRVPYSRPGWDSALDYSHQEVRDYTLKLIAELFERYDVDGMELDWMRMPKHLRDDRGLEDGHFLTEVTRKTREMARSWEKKRGHRILVSVRVPTHPDNAKGWGMDAVSWAKEGLVDVIVPCNFFNSSDFNIPYRLWVERTAGTGVRIIPGTDGAYSMGSKNKMSPMEMPTYYGWAESLYHKGARDFYLFNFFYKDYLGPRFKPILENGFTPEAFEKECRRFIATWRDFTAPGMEKEDQLPRKIGGGQIAVIKIPMGACAKTGRTGVFVGLGGHDETTRTAFPTVKLNGVELKKPAKSEKGSRGGMPLFLFRYPAGLETLKEGEGVVEVSLPASVSTQNLIWCEIEVNGQLEKK